MVHEGCHPCENYAIVSPSTWSWSLTQDLSRWILMLIVKPYIRLAMFEVKSSIWCCSRNWIARHRRVRVSLPLRREECLSFQANDAPSLFIQWVLPFSWSNDAFFLSRHGLFLFVKVGWWWVLLHRFHKAWNSAATSRPLESVGNMETGRCPVGL